MVKSHEDPYYESIYLSKEDSFYLSAFVLSKKKIYRLVKAFFRTDGVPLPAHLFLRVVQTRAHGKILIIFDKNRVLLAKNRRAPIMK
ncbi:MAG: hypothetical protein ACI90V_003630 [Bacillariaceae sp.]|jgi:hypothetical protein